MRWWERNNLRLIQTNLRETDAALDAASIVSTLKDINANVLLANTGGVVAFYPTDLPFHYRSPFLEGDPIGELVSRCHDAGIRFFARFDFSKAHETIYRAHPEWFYRSSAGEAINYNGMVHTCVNGAYQRERSLEILAEVLERYPIDGVFFNMFGYVTRDYNNTYHGICRCEMCRRRFRDMYDRELPASEDGDDPVLPAYRAFQRQTVAQILDSIRAVVKTRSEDIAISTYTDHGVDIVKDESNTEIHRPYPLWEYSASENVQTVEGTWDDKTVSNVCINAVGIDYRFMGVPEEQVGVRLYQAMSAGSGLDFCIVGVFDDYPDRKALPVVRKTYRFHAEHERYFGTFELVADALLIRPHRGSSPERMAEFRGLFRILKESHVPFRVVDEWHLSDAHAAGCKVIIAPDLDGPDVRLCALLERSLEAGTSVVWTGTRWSDEENLAFRSLFGVGSADAAIDGRWSYLLNSSPQQGPRDADTDWVMLDGPFVPVSAVPSARTALERLSAGRFGPPERCGGNEPTGEPGLIVTTHSSARAILYPFSLGALYHRFAYPEHRGLLDRLLSSHELAEPSLHTNATPDVEVFLARYSDTEAHDLPRYAVHLVNLSGFNGSTFRAPHLIGPITVELDIPQIASGTRATALVRKTDLETDDRDGRLIVTLPELDRHETILLG